MAKANANLIGECYRKLHKYDSALLWHNKCLSVCQNKFLNDTLWQGIAQTSIAAVYNDENKHAQALAYFLKGTTITKNLGIYLIDNTINAYSDIVAIYIEKQNYKHANQYL